MHNPQQYRELITLLENIEQGQDRQQLDEITARQAAAGLGAAAALGGGATGAQAQTAGDWLNLAKNVASAVQQAQSQSGAPEAPTQRVELKPGQFFGVKIGDDYNNRDEVLADINKLKQQGHDVQGVSRADGTFYIVSKPQFDSQQSAQSFANKARQDGLTTKIIIRNSPQPQAQQQAEPPRSSAQQAQPQRAAEPTRAESPPAPKKPTGVVKIGNLIDSTNNTTLLASYERILNSQYAWVAYTRTSAGNDVAKAQERRSAALDKAKRMRDRTLDKADINTNRQYHEQANKTDRALSNAYDDGDAKVLADAFARAMTAMGY